jgi:hypothetical protein
LEFKGKCDEIQGYLKKVDEEVPAELAVLLEGKTGLDAKKKELIERIKDHKDQRDKLSLVKKEIRKLELRKSEITGVRQQNYKCSDRDDGCGLVRVGTFLE